MGSGLTKQSLGAHHHVARDGTVADGEHAPPRVVLYNLRWQRSTSDSVHIVSWSISSMQHAVRERVQKLASSCCNGRSRDDVRGRNDSHDPHAHCAKLPASLSRGYELGLTVVSVEVR